MEASILLEKKKEAIKAYKEFDKVKLLKLF